MAKKKVLVLVLLILMVSFSWAEGRDDFLGSWSLADNSMTIKIIKEGERYYVIEFVHLKHELFFSGDGSRALFIEYGKGPGWDTSMLLLDGDAITRMHFSEEYDWKPSQYVYYRRR